MISDCQNCQNRVIAKIENRTMAFGNAGKNFGNYGNSDDFGNPH